MKIRVSGQYFFFGLTVLLAITTILFGYYYFTKQPKIEYREVIIRPEPIILVVSHIEHGLASWYGLPEHNKIMANGEVYNMFDPHVAAHTTLPFETVVLVVNKQNNKSAVVIIKDRLSRSWLKEGRIIDLSFAAGREIDMLEAGLIPVELKVIKTSKNLTPEAIHRYRKTIETGGE